MSTLVLIRIISMLGKCSRMLNKNKIDSYYSGYSQDLDMLQ